MNSSSSELWRFVDADAVYCINLKEATDRYEYVLGEFERVGLRNVQFHHVDRDPRGGRFGCFVSHLDVVKKAFGEEKERVLIFEDDLCFGEGWETVVAQCGKFIERSTVSWDALFLGSCIHYLQGEVDPELNIVKCNITKTHALCVSRQGMAKMIENEEMMVKHMKTLTHDRLLNGIWNDIYAHFEYNVVSQNQDFDSANIWIDTGVDWMDEWLTNKIIPGLQDTMLPLEKRLLKRGQCSIGAPLSVSVDNKPTTIQSTPLIALLQVGVGISLMFKDDKMKLLRALPIIPKTVWKVFTNENENK